MEPSAADPAAATSPAAASAAPPTPAAEAAGDAAGSDSDTDSSSTVAMSELSGADSDAEEDEAAEGKKRGFCGQYVWPCPREYPANPEQRKKKKFLIPEDLDKASFGALFKKALLACNQLANANDLHCFDEPHKKYNKKTKRRARHKHMVFRMKSTFSHIQVAKKLRSYGIHGNFSFNLVGYKAYLCYMMQESPKKLQCDLDLQPWSHPKSTTPEKLLAIVEKENPQQDARNGLVPPAASKSGRKRSLLTPSEITDAFVENEVRTAKDAWILAKSRKLSGDVTLYNTLHKANDVEQLVAKHLTAWNCEQMDTGTLVKAPDFILAKFLPLGQIDKKLVSWLRGDWKSLVLVLCGPGGLGKTELACAIMHCLVKSVGFHFVNKVDRLRDVLFTPGQGLVVDEVCLKAREIDDVKALIDLMKARDVSCRNKDGRIPKGVPRILVTNWKAKDFWPDEAREEAHARPIERRHVWVDVLKDVRKLSSSASASTSPPVAVVLPTTSSQSSQLPAGYESEEDIFGFGNEGIE